MESSYSSHKYVNLHFDPPILAEETSVFNPNTQTLSFVDHTIKIIFIKSTLPLSFFTRYTQQYDKETTIESFESRIKSDSIFSARQTIHSLHNTVTNRRVFPQCRFSEKCKKSQSRNLIQQVRTISPLQNSCDQLQHLTSTSDIGRVDMHVISILFLLKSL